MAMQSALAFAKNTKILSSDPLNPDLESARLSALDQYDILDSPSEEAFDRITRLAKKFFDVPIAIVSFIDAHRQWYKSCQGLTSNEAPREHTFCRYVIDNGQPLVVPDATKDLRFAMNPYVTGEPGVRFYAGLPLQTKDGYNIGSLCLVDVRPRKFRPSQLEIMSDLAEMVMDELQLRICANKDALTGASSRRAFKEEAGRLISLALRHHQDLSAIAFDIDHFKQINDSWGHAAGDRVLSEIIRTCYAGLRETDPIGRVGGEEFAVVLPNTSSDAAVGVAEKLRANIERRIVSFEGQELKVTVSFGVASLDSTTRVVDALLDRADKALYEAKKTGRNRVVVWRGRSDEGGDGRRRVLKAGQILFNGRTSNVDCTVRSISPTGAGLDVIATANLPKLFYLVIAADGFDKPCHVVSKTDRHIEVAFS